MRNTDERLAAVQRCVRELEQQKKYRQQRYISLFAAAACLVIIVGMGIAMPGIIAGISGGDYTNVGMMASIFSESSALGYILIGLLAFALGVCLTILCFLQQANRQRHKEEHHNDRDH